MTFARILFPHVAIQNISTQDSVFGLERTNLDGHEETQPLYLALDAIYDLIHAPIPKRVTCKARREAIVYSTHQ